MLTSSQEAKFETFNKFGMKSSDEQTGLCSGVCHVHLYTMTFSISYNKETNLKS